MHEYDVTLKLLLQSSADSVLRQVIGGVHVTRWLNAELQQVQTRRADLLGQAADERLIHIELQSSNDSDMAVRMAEYSLGIYRQFGRFPKQIVLYVGEPPLRMPARLSGPDPSDPDFAFRYALFDFRDLDGAALMESRSIEDNVLAILTRLQNQAATIREIMARITTLDEPARRTALAKFLIISGLRRLGQVIREEAKKMPILNDILDHDVLGPAIRQGREEGRVESLRPIFEKRFGPMPVWIEDRLIGLSANELAEVAVRLLDAPSVQELFPR